MIVDVDSLDPLVIEGVASLSLLKVGSDRLPIGLRINHGHIAMRAGSAYPVINGQTSLMHFEDGNPAKYIHTLAEPLHELGELQDAVFMPGNANYYHFLAFHMPALLLLLNEPGASLRLATATGFPASCEQFFIDTVIPSLSGGRPVEIIRLATGDYAVRNVVYRIKPGPWLSTFMARTVRDMIWTKAKLTNPVEQLGPLKLFVPRTDGANGRNLQNQYEVTEWFEAHGYVTIEPGALTFEQQVVLFSRATHIAGVEGAALTNLMFAPAARHAVMLTSPNVFGEPFFSAITMEMGFPLDVIAGCVPSEGFMRNSDYSIPLERLDQYARGTLDLAWFRRYDPA